MQRKEILCTLGPASRTERIIKRLEDLGVNLFRINLSHTKLEDAERVINEIKAHTSVPICLDTEGAQVRTGDLKDTKVSVQEEDIIRICSEEIKGDGKEFNFYPSHVANELEVGDIISIDFNSVLVQVIHKDIGGVVVRVLTGGVLGQNKAVTVDREIPLPALTDKDHAILKIGLSMGIKHVALSFANSGQDVDFIRSIVGQDVFLISKVESINGIKNLAAIADRSNAVLIDRGDMSRQVPIEQIPRAQKVIIRRVKECGAKVYVATNLLESMIVSANPTRAEVNDIFNTLVDGADGLVLAAETAIGAYPVQSAMMVNKVMRQYENYFEGIKFKINDLQNANSFVLIEPHGGRLVNRLNPNADMPKIEQYKRMHLDEKTLLDVEQIALGTYSPLEGFMTEETLKSVLADFRLPNGLAWPLPILLQATKDKVEGINVGDNVALCDEQDTVYATIKVQDIYKIDLDDVAREIFHTTNEDHPGVAYLKQKGPYCIGGNIEMVKRLPASNKHYQLTPRQTRMIFDNKGWSRVVGFHTRNVAHRVHEYLQLLAFEKHHCDGLFVHPLVGPKKKGDYAAEIVLRTYDLILSQYYPKNKSLLAAFQSYPRYSGPREAVFTALCRKNFGCSHFVVGRDHSGVGNYYEPDAGHRLFEALGDIGIVPIFFNEFGYSEKEQKYIEVSEQNAGDLLNISGTEGRKMLQNKECPPNWFMREDVAQLIINDLEEGKEVFI